MPNMNNNLIQSFNEIQSFIGKTVYRICPKCNEHHKNSCDNCAWRGTSYNGCNVYGIWDDGQYPKEKSHIVSQKLTWDWIPSFIENLGKRTFYTIEAAEKTLI